MRVGLIALLLGEVLAVVSLRTGLGLRFWVNTGAIGAVTLFVLWVVWFGVRRRFQFTLRSLIITWTVIALGLSILTWWRQKANEQRMAVVALESVGQTSVHYSYEFDDRGRFRRHRSPTPLPDWVERILRDDFFYDVEEVSIRWPKCTDSDFEHLRRLPSIKRLEISHTDVTDAGLEHLRSLKRLQRLHVDYAPYVTKDGLLLLQDLPCLKELGLSHMCIDAPSLRVLKQAMPKVIIGYNSPLPVPECCGARSVLGIEPTTVPLAEAVASFNEKADDDPVGATQPPLTEDEVVAAIRDWEPSEIQIRIDANACRIVRQIGDSREFPSLAEFDFITGWTGPADTVTVWWVDLKVHTSTRAGSGLRVRDTIISGRLPEWAR